MKYHLTIYIQVIILSCFSSPSALSSNPEELPSRKPNIILFSIDTLRADHLSCYGYSRETSPHIDEFSKDAALFNNTVSQSPITAPSHMSIFTSLVPPVHGVNNISELGLKHSLDEKIITMPQLLKRNGYYTVGLHGKGQVSGEMGFKHGFDKYLPTFSNWERGTGRRSASLKGLEKIIACIRKHVQHSAKNKKPLFLFLHHYLCHDPYTKGPKEFREHFFNTWVDGLKGRQAGDRDSAAFWAGVDLDIPQDYNRIISLYDGGIYYSDYVFKKVIDALKEEGIYDNSVIILLSDHGEEFNEHGGTRHGRLWVEHLHVPLIIKLPNNKHAGTIIEAPVRLMDLMPTIFEYLGVPISHPIQGVSFLSLITNQGKYNPLMASYRTATHHEVIKEYSLKILKDDYSFISHVDPLNDLHAGQKPPDNIANVTLELDPGVENEDHLNGVELGDRYFAEDDFEKAGEIYTAAIKDSPYNKDLLLKSAICYREMEIYEKAIELFNKAQKASDNNYRVYLEWGRCAKGQGDYAQAKTLFKKVQELAPDNPEGFFEYGRTCQKQGELTEAKENINRAIKIDSGKQNYFIVLARLYKKEGQHEKAVDMYHKAIKINPQVHWLIKDFAIYCRDIGKVSELERTYQQIMTQNPHLLWSYYSLGNYYERKGCIEDAENVYKKMIKLNPDNAKGYRILGDLYLNREEFIKAEIMYGKAKNVIPDKGDLNISLGALYRETQRYTAAEREFNKAIDMGADEAQVYLELSELYSQQGKSKKAEEMCCKAIITKPRLNREYMNYSLFNMGKDNKEEHNLLNQANIIKSMCIIEKEIRKENNDFLSLIKKGSQKEFKPDKDLLRQLKALGYAN